MAMAEAAMAEEEVNQAGEAVRRQEAAMEVVRPANSSADAAWFALKQQWSKSASKVEPQVRWWMEADRLNWEMRMPLPLTEWPASPPGKFVEGLWDQDVAEFFIADRTTGRYHEFNLGPGGAWWSATFRAPRVRIAPQPEWEAFGVTTAVFRNETHWIGQLSLPLPQLAGSEGRNFYSWADLGGPVPDFHRPLDWIPL